ncbi:hypothetical protein GT043_19415, partial [Streptomyces sp. SID2131]|nr:hypothetical protein [Streptomyces sp. SID2131]
MLEPLRADAPRRIGPYEVLARLGAGGMGEVFLARGTGLPETGPGAGTGSLGAVPGAGTGGSAGEGGAGAGEGASGGGASRDGASGGGVSRGGAAAPLPGVFVAVKTVRRDVAGEPAFRDRFRREIKVASLVDSPYAAAPVGGDADAGTPWL